MIVRLLQAFPALPPGSEWECDEAEAARLIAAGIAEPIRDARPSPPSVERATRPQAETATAPRLRGEALRRKFEEVVGVKPGRRKEETMLEQIAEAEAGEC